MSKYSEIRNDFVDETENKVYIDAWVGNCEDGTVIAKIDVATLKVKYLDKDARTDAYAQEVIKETINLLKNGLY